ncbi:MAG: hypothetical protein J6W69_06570, partial [Bacteroidales bacterium]|nr:hypothetical protein [Bacteroidales bacterium]
DFKAAVDAEMAKGASVKVACMKTLKPIIARIIDTVCFDGNGYAAEWAAEAQKRGLDTERCVPKMFLENVKPESVEMFEKMGVFTAAELHARNEVKFETYIKLVQIESRVLGDLAINQSSSIDHLPVNPLAQYGHDEVALPDRMGRPLGSRNRHHQEDCRLQRRHQDQGRCHGREAQGGQPHRGPIREGDGLLRYCRVVQRHPQANRPSGGHRR